MTTFAKSNIMDSTITARLGRLARQIEVLTARRDEALERLEATRKEADGLKERIRDLEERLRRSDLDVSYLKLSHKLADSPQALADARSIIGGLIRKVETAIALLKNDPQI